MLIHSASQLLTIPVHPSAVMTLVAWVSSQMARYSSRG